MKIKLQTPSTPENVLAYWRNYSECLYCHQDIKHEIHLYRHYFKWHADSYKTTGVYFRLVRVFYFHDIQGNTYLDQIPIRNFTDYKQMEKVRDKYRKNGYTTAVVLCRKGE